MIADVIPYLIYLMMFTVGTNLTASQWSKIKAAPSHYIWGTLGQVLLLPLMAYTLVLILQPKDEIAIGLLLVSLCPAGAVSNLYAYIAKANVALSVTLTLLTNVISIVSLPIVITLLFATRLTGDEFANFVQQQLNQLVSMLLIPLLLGALFQHFLSNLLSSIKKGLEAITFSALLTVIGSIFVEHTKTIKTEFFELLIPAACFTILALLIAKTLSKLLGLNSPDTTAFLAEFPSRNLALVAVISVSFLGNSEYLIFAGMFFVVESPILLFLMLRHRQKINRLCIQQA